jgi:G3E family GTPase
MMKVDIVSGFLGAGKTTLIKKLLEEAFTGDKVALIENEFGEIGIDGTILKDYGIEIKEMNSGCICCTIAGDFSLALKEIITIYHPDRIIIEPSGVGKLSNVIDGCRKFLKKGTVELNMCIVVVDGMKYKMYLKNFTEFYKDQLKEAKTVILSRTQYMKPDAVEYVVNDIKKCNPTAMIVTTGWEQIDGKRIIELAEKSEEIKLENGILNELNTKHINEKKVYESHTHTHHADEVFSVWGKETAKIFKYDRLKEILNLLEKAQGYILRAKGIVRVENNRWVQFDYTPGENNLNETVPDYTSRICVIGENINEQELSDLFEL